MGLGDLLGKVVDTVIDLPGDVAKAATEVVTRLPESGLKIAKGVEKGANKALEKIEEILDDE